MTVTEKNTTKHIMKNVWGEVPKKHISAIMGPSGAGKTSLLNVLSGRARTRRPVSVEADVRLDNLAVDPTNLQVRQQIAFVTQEDSLMPTATPRECIRFSAKLRLPRSTTDEEIERLTTKMLMELGLMDCADTLVGGGLVKGISGGERKRTSIGVELVTKPALVFLDEPTSGLDSFSALQLVHVLRKVSDAGASVMFTIHQPASEIFNSFDHLILMNQGQVMYQGSVSNVPIYFEARGHPLPENHNPADWIMTVAQQTSQHDLDSDGFFPPDDRQLGDALNSKDLNLHNVDVLGFSTQESHPHSPRKLSQITQIRILYRRELLDLKRDKASLGARFGITIFLNLLFGLIFMNVGRHDDGSATHINSHFGAAMIVLLSTMFGNAQPAIFAIPAQRPIFIREYSTDHYSVGAYFVARFTIEAVMTLTQAFVQLIIVYFFIGFQAHFFQFLAVLYALAMTSAAAAVFLGCAIEDLKVAQEMLPLVFVPQMLFSGFFVSTALIPVWLRWCQYICSLTYGVRLFLLAEFEECAAYNTSDAGPYACQFLLKRLHVKNDNEWWYWVSLVVLFVLFRLGAMWVLKRKASEFS